MLRRLRKNVNVEFPFNTSWAYFKVIYCISTTCMFNIIFLSKKDLGEIPFSISIFLNAHRGMSIITFNILFMIITF